MASLKYDTVEAVFQTLVSDGVISTQNLSEDVLRELGDYGVSEDEGLVTVTDPEFLDGLAIQAAVQPETRNWLRRVDVQACTGSTNSDLLETQATESVDGVALLAEVQTGGRGRRGRQWVSPFAKNIALSLGMCVDQPTSDIGPISLSIGLAVATTLQNYGMPDITLKWPNDVLFRGQKIAGILIELADAEPPATLIVGIGVNVHAAPGVDVTGDYRATCVVDYLASPDRNDLAIALLDNVYARVKQYEKEGFGSSMHEWQALDFLRNKQVMLSSGSQTTSGRALGIDRDGSYRIETENGIERAIGGDLSLRLAS